MITSRDVARTAGVSQATVWAVLSGKRFVSDDLRRRVLAAVEELGYHPDEVARSLKTRRSGVVGVVIPTLGAHTWNLVLAGVEGVLSLHGLNMILCHADEDYQRERSVLDLLHRRRVEGLLVAPVGPESREPIERLLRAEVPVVMNSRRLPEVSADAVITDEEGGARAIVSHVLKLGRRRIAVVAMPEWSTPGGARLAGYRRALREFGIPADPQMEATARSTEGNGFALAGRLLDLHRPPDAIFASTHTMTMGVLSCLKARGLRIPEDIALVSYDDLPWTQHVAPPLTTVWQPQRELGATAAEILIQRLQGSLTGEPRLVTLKTKLVIRRSCGAPATQPPEGGRDRDAAATPDGTVL